MSILDKNLSRQPLIPRINIFDRNSLLTNEHVKNIRQIVRDYYHGSESETLVVEKIKNATGLKAGRVTVEHDTTKNIINVFYCCSPSLY